MKKLLLGSTALVVGGLMAAPAMAADPIKMGVGGYYTFYGAAGNIDPTYAMNGSFTNYKGFGFIQEGEIHFIGQTKLDNGTSVGLTVELEAWNPSSATANAQIDEAFLFAFGDWGRVELGSRDAATYRMYYGSPSALIGWGAIQHNHNWANLSAQANNKAYARMTATTNTPTWQDVNRINYFTPRFAGLQIGVGYAPKLNAASAGGQAASGPGNPAGICGYNNATNVDTCPTADYAWQDVFDVGANYLNKFGDFTVALYGAFAYASFVPGFGPVGGVFPNVAANQITGANLTAWKQWVVGAQFGFAGFTVGGALGYDNNGLGCELLHRRRQRHPLLHRRYHVRDRSVADVVPVGRCLQHQRQRLGERVVDHAGHAGPDAQHRRPRAVSRASTAPAFNGNASTALNFGVESAQKFEVGVNYALGPGIKAVGGFMYNNIAGPSNAVSGNNWVVLLGMDLRF